MSGSRVSWQDSAYFTPPFPSLYWPINNSKYPVAFIHYISDIWWFTALWTVIMYAMVYTLTAAVALVSYRKTLSIFKLVSVAIYIGIGVIHGFINGTIAGYIIGVMYRAGLFGMSTWVPFCVAVAQILFLLVWSYSRLSIVI